MCRHSKDYAKLSGKAFKNKYSSQNCYLPESRYYIVVCLISLFIFSFCCKLTWLRAVPALLDFRFWVLRPNTSLKKLCILIRSTICFIKLTEWLSYRLSKTNFSTWKSPSNFKESQSSLLELIVWSSLY